MRLRRIPLIAFCLLLPLHLGVVDGAGGENSNPFYYSSGPFSRVSSVQSDLSAFESNVHPSQRHSANPFADDEDNFNPFAAEVTANEGQQDSPISEDHATAERPVEEPNDEQTQHHHSPKLAPTPPLPANKDSPKHGLHNTHPADSRLHQTAQQQTGPAAALPVQSGIQIPVTGPVHLHQNVAPVNLQTGPIPMAGHHLRTGPILGQNKHLHPGSGQMGAPNGGNLPGAEPSKFFISSDSGDPPEYGSDEAAAGPAPPAQLPTLNHQIPAMVWPEHKKHSPLNSPTAPNPADQVPLRSMMGTGGNSPLKMGQVPNFAQNGMQNAGAHQMPGLNPQIGQRSPSIQDFLKLHGMGASNAQQSPLGGHQQHFSGVANQGLSPVQSGHLSAQLQRLGTGLGQGPQLGALAHLPRSNSVSQLLAQIQSNVSPGGGQQPNRGGNEQLLQQMLMQNQQQRAQLPRQDSVSQMQQFLQERANAAQQSSSQPNRQMLPNSPSISNFSAVGGQMGQSATGLAQNQNLGGKLPNSTSMADIQRVLAMAQLQKQQSGLGTPSLQHQTSIRVPQLNRNQGAQMPNSASTASLQDFLAMAQLQQQQKQQQSNFGGTPSLQQQTTFKMPAPQQTQQNQPVSDKNAAIQRWLEAADQAGGLAPVAQQQPPQNDNPQLQALLSKLDPSTAAKVMQAMQQNAQTTNANHPKLSHSPSALSFTGSNFGGTPSQQLDLLGNPLPPQPPRHQQQHFANSSQGSVSGYRRQLNQGLLPAPSMQRSSNSIRSVNSFNGYGDNRLIGPPSQMGHSARGGGGRPPVVPPSRLGRQPSQQQSAYQPSAGSEYDNQSMASYKSGALQPKQSLGGRQEATLEQYAGLGKYNPAQPSLRDNNLFLSNGREYVVRNSLDYKTRVFPRWEIFQVYPLSRPQIAKISQNIRREQKARESRGARGVPLEEKMRIATEMRQRMDLEFRRDRVELEDLGMRRYKKNHRVHIDEKALKSAFEARTQGRMKGNDPWAEQLEVWHNAFDGTQNYFKRTGKNLDKDLEAKMSSWYKGNRGTYFKHLYVGTALSRKSLLKMALWDSTLGMSGTDSSDLIELLVTLTPEERQWMNLPTSANPKPAGPFVAEYPDFCNALSHEDELQRGANMSDKFTRAKDNISDYGDLMVGLCQFERGTEGVTREDSEEELKTWAKQLNTFLKNFEYEPRIRQMFTQYSYTRLRRIFDTYFAVYNQSVYNRVDKAWDLVRNNVPKSPQDHLKQVVKCIVEDVHMGRPFFFARLLYSKILKLMDNRTGNDFDAFNDIARIVLTRGPIDLVDIDAEFRRINGSQKSIIARFDDAIQHYNERMSKKRGGDEIQTLEVLKDIVSWVLKDYNQEDMRDFTRAQFDREFRQDFMVHAEVAEQQQRDFNEQRADDNDFYNPDEDDEDADEIQSVRDEGDSFHREQSLREQEEQYWHEQEGDEHFHDAYEQPPPYREEHLPPHHHDQQQHQVPSHQPQPYQEPNSHQPPMQNLIDF